MAIDIIYCAAGNKRFTEIALAAGMKYGAQMPGKVYHSPYFVDQNWKNPVKPKYMAALSKYRPHMATVLDWEREEQFEEVMEWAEEAAQYVEKVIIIPKVMGQISRIPEMVNGKDIILGYSVPSKYSGTELPPWQFGQRPVHLLGGSPLKQVSLAHYLNVISADGNYAQKVATKYWQYFVATPVRWAANKHWPTIAEANDGIPLAIRDGHYIAFERSCINIVTMWNELQGITTCSG